MRRAKVEPKTFFFTFIMFFFGLCTHSRIAAPDTPRGLRLVSCIGLRLVSYRLVQFRNSIVRFLDVRLGGGAGGSPPPRA